MSAVVASSTPISSVELEPGVGPVITGPYRRLIKNSFWYQWRSVITSISVLGCWVLGLYSAPRILEGTLAAWSLNALGWTFFTAGVAVRLWATLYIGGRKAKGVVEQGPYSVCRNPLYWGTLFVLVSAVLLFKSAIFGAGLIIPILIYMWGVVPAEEAYLTEKLGEGYLDYCSRVPRWWPCFGQYKSPEEITLNIRGLRAECLRILGWIWLPFVIHTLCVLRMQSWWYAPLNLP